MLGIIILPETVTIRVFTCDERKQIPFQDCLVPNTFHYPSENANFCSTSVWYASPYMNLQKYSVIYLWSQQIKPRELINHVVKCSSGNFYVVANRFRVWLIKGGPFDAVSTFNSRRVMQQIQMHANVYTLALNHKYMPINSL